MIISSSFQSDFPVKNGHLETIVPYFLRRVDPLNYKRERITTSDDDFIDLDWVHNSKQRLVILSHGLEGCSKSSYIQGMAQELLTKGFDILAWNNRGCSGEQNNHIYSYHSGASFDLKQVIDHALARPQYKEVFLVGFSMGGNQTLKYLGEQGSKLPAKIKRAVTISTPVSLEDCAKALSNPMGRVYTKNFIIRMNRKLKKKAKTFESFNPDFKKLHRAWDFETFDNLITAPLFGFHNAQDYWQQASSLPVLTRIEIPTLIINAQNDPFLMGRCFPFEMVKDHPLVHLEAPKRGGHVGFTQNGLSKVWTEKRVSSYLMADESLLNGPLL